MYCLGNVKSEGDSSWLLFTMESVLHGDKVPTLPCFNTPLETFPSERSFNPRQIIILVTKNG